MNTVFWVIQGIVAAMFAMAGIMKSTQTKEKLEPKVPWVKDFALGTVRLIGISELLGAVGLIVPQLTGIVPILTPVAASCLVLVMVMAMVYHFRKQEFKEMAFNATLLILSAAIAYYRFEI